MSLKTFITKWEAQLKALNPKYDIVYEVSKDEPIKFKDSENVKLSFATIADTHLIDNEIAEKNLANVFEDIGNSKEKFEYCAIGGDLTNAYDKDTVSEVKRHMVCISTNRKVNPMAFVIFDKITSIDANFKKTLLFHTLNAPLVTEVNNKPCSVVTNLMSRLYIQSLLTEVDHSFVGGEGNEFSVNGKNCSPYFDGRVEGVKNEYNTEYGFGRIEISPKNPARENSFLTVMYVTPDTDCSPYLDLNTNILQPYHEAVEIGDEHTVGTAILGSGILFASTGEYIENNICVKLPEDVERCLLCGIKAGTWIDDSGNEYVVNENECTLEISVKDKLVLKKA